MAMARYALKNNNEQNKYWFFLKFWINCYNWVYSIYILYYFSVYSLQDFEYKHRITHLCTSYIAERDAFSNETLQ